MIGASKQLQEPRPQAFWRERGVQDIPLEPKVGAFKHTGELVYSVMCRQLENRFITADTVNELNDKKKLERFIVAANIDDKSRKIYLLELNRLFDVAALRV